MQVLTCTQGFPVAFLLIINRASDEHLTGAWRNGSASDSRSEGWEFEPLCPHSSDAHIGNVRHGDLTPEPSEFEPDALAVFTRMSATTIANLCKHTCLAVGECQRRTNKNICKHACPSAREYQRRTNTTNPTAPLHDTFNTAT